MSNYNVNLNIILITYILYYSAIIIIIIIIIIYSIALKLFTVLVIMTIAV